MIHCKELTDKVVRLVTIYEDGMYPLYTYQLKVTGASKTSLTRDRDK